MRARQGNDIGCGRWATAAEAHNPLEQFEIHPILPINIGGLDVSFTNSALWMVIAAALVYTLVMYGARHASMVPGRCRRWSS